MLIFFLITLISCLINIVNSSTRIPIVTSESYSIMLGQYLDINPFKQLSDDLHITSINNQICQLKKAQFNNTIIHYFPLKQSSGSISSIIYTLQQLHHLRYAIDMIQFNKKYYIVFGDGSIEIVQVVENNKIQKISKMKRNVKFQEGFFTSNSENLLYVTGVDVSLITDTQIIEVTGYKENNKFISCSLTEDNLLLISLDQDGFAIYNYENGTLLNYKNYNKMNLFTHNIEITDIAYDPAIYLLMILDRQTGIKFYNLKNNFALQNTSYALNETQCENMIYKNSAIYLTCSKLIKYNLTSNKIEQKPLPLIATSNIQIIDQAIYLTSDSHIGLYLTWQSQPIYTQIYDATTVIVSQDRRFVLFMNDYEIFLSNFSYIRQSLKCGSNKNAGDFQINVEGTAKCNKSFIISNTNNKSDINQDDDCIYVKKFYANVWQIKKIKWVPILIVGGLIIWGLTVFFIWCCVKNVKLQRQYSQLEERISSMMTEVRGEGGKKETYNVLNEQKENK